MADPENESRCGMNLSAACSRSTTLCRNLSNPLPRARGSHLRG